MASSSTHRWKFFRAGGVDQVSLREGRDIVRLPDLDPKLWVALAMPTKGVALDPRTLELLDGDKDGRVRVPEVQAAARFVAATFADPEEVVKGGDSVALAALKDEKLVAAARRVLGAVGKGSADSVSLADVEEHAKVVHTLPLNGDGVLPPGSAGDDDTRAVIADIMSTGATVKDKGGEVGVNQAIVDDFFAKAQATVDWLAKADTDAAVLPLGPATADAAKAVAAVRAKIDDFFTRGRLAGFDARAHVAMNGAEAEFVALAAKELAPGSADVARLPLARVEPGRPLSLKDGLNPAWVGPMAAFAAAAARLLKPGLSVLNEADWAALQARLAAWDAWQAARPAGAVDALGADRLKAILAGPARGKLGELIAKDAAQEALNAEVVEVERALLYKRDLLEVLQNFVSFSRFYARRGAAFQAGTLYLDGRACDLTLEVHEPAKHATLASMADAYLAYCDLVRPGGEKKTIVAAFTGGDSDNLFVGRNGVFYDRKGRDWDATISKVVTNPISIREAFWSPYKKAMRLVEEQVQKRAAERDAKAQEMTAQAATAVAHADSTKPPEGPKKVDIGAVAAIGVAVGGIGAFLVGIVTAILGLGVWMPLGFLAILLIISGPAMVLAYLKLRHRNLGPLLDANGWAINGRARINVPFGGALTDIARLPKGAERTLDDPYAEKRRPWSLYVTIAILLVLGGSWFLGKLDAYLPKSAKAQTVFDRGPAPAPAPAPPAKP